MGIVGGFPDPALVVANPQSWVSLLRDMSDSVGFN